MQILFVTDLQKKPEHTYTEIFKKCWFEKKLVGQNTNLWIHIPSSPNWWTCELVNENFLNLFLNLFIFPHQTYSRLRLTLWTAALFAVSFPYCFRIKLNAFEASWSISHLETVCVQFGSRKSMKSKNYEDKNEAVMQTDTY